MRQHINSYQSSAQKLQLLIKCLVGGQTHIFITDKRGKNPRVLSDTPVHIKT